MKGTKIGNSNHFWGVCVTVGLKQYLCWGLVWGGKNGKLIWVRTQNRYGLKLFIKGLRMANFNNFKGECSVAKSYPTNCDPMDWSTSGFLFFTIFWSLLKFMSIELVMLSNHFILYHTLLLPSVFPRIKRAMLEGKQTWKIVLNHSTEGGVSASGVSEGVCCHLSSMFFYFCQL